MSGPKIDQAELERQKKEALERARLERIRKIKEATESCDRILQEIKNTISSVNAEFSEQIRQASTEAAMQDTVDRIRGAKARLAKQLLQVMDISIPAEPEEILALNSMLQNSLSKAREVYRSDTKSDYDRILSFFEEVKGQRQLSSFSSSLEELEKEDMTTISFCFSEKINRTEVITEELKQAAKTAMEELAEILNSEFSSISCRQVASKYVKSIIRDLQNDPTGLKKTIQEFNLAKIRIQKDLADLDDLYQEYIAEYVVFIDEVNASRREKLDIVPKSRKAFETREALQAEITELKTISRRVNEQNYIKEQINEVMALFGYQMCEDIVLDPEQSGEHYLCEHRDGKKAVHIQVLGAKQIMMEVVGTAQGSKAHSRDITAEYENTCTDQETEALLREQGYFCLIHPKITEELRKRGVILRERVHREPSRMYCRNIINYGAFSDKYTEKKNKEVYRVVNPETRRVEQRKKLLQKEMKVRT